MKSQSPLATHSTRPLRTTPKSHLYNDHPDKIHMRDLLFMYNRLEWRRTNKKAPRLDGLIDLRRALPDPKYYGPRPTAIKVDRDPYHGESLIRASPREEAEDPEEPSDIRARWQVRIEVISRPVATLSLCEISSLCVLQEKNRSIRNKIWLFMGRRETKMSCLFFLL